MYEFEYSRPKSVDDAVALLHRDGSKLLGGGMSIVPVMRHRLARPSMLVDLGAIAALKKIEVEGDRLWIGGGATHYAVSTSPIVQRCIPALCKLAGGIGDPLVRNRGTIGGSLAHNDPAACYPSALLALNGTVNTNRRKIAADDFILGTFQTALEPAEIIVGVSFPKIDTAAYVKFANLSSRFSIVGVFLARTGREVRIGITGAGHHAFRARDLERALTDNFSAAVARAMRVSARDLLTDIHASAEYRAHLIPELTARAVEEAGAR